MKKSGLDYLLQFSKIQKGEKIGNLEALEFCAIQEGTQMGHLIVDCMCHKSYKRFQISANILNWKITMFRKGALLSLDSLTVQSNQH